MLFNSLEFVVFFPCVAFLYFAIPPRFRWVLLLAASYIFYMAWQPAYILLLLASTIVDYAAARLMESKATQAERRPFLYLSLCANLGLLFSFKYFNFFSSTIEDLLNALGFEYAAPDSHLLLPVGISFYTFQTLGYAIDVYRGRQKPERHLGVFALYVAFFPQLVAGPIERAGSLLPQLRACHDFDYDRVTHGLRLILWGMVKKVVIADRLAPAVNAIYGAPENFDGPALALATVFFAFQIYCDFSAYTDIAIGTAEVFGVRLMRNFRQPYFAASIADFWRRWHISLSTWFRDYVYISLGGNRVSVPRWYINLAVVFVVSGLWHGANWTFVVWGGLHGLFMIASHVIGRTFSPQRPSGENRGRRVVRQSVRVLGTFVLVTLSWIFFRAASLNEALYILAHLFDGWSDLLTHEGRAAVLQIRGLTQFDFAVGAVGIGVLLVVDAIVERDPGADVARWPVAIRWLLYSVALWSIVFLGIFGEKEFIYFAF